MYELFWLKYLFFIRNNGNYEDLYLSNQDFRNLPDNH